MNSDHLTQPTGTAESLGKAAHTPGPWHFHAKLSGSENHRGYRVYGPGADGWTLAEVIPVDEDGIEGGANARLIAAAPAMRELLEQFDQNVDRLGHGSYSLESREGFDAQLFLDQVRGILAGAEPWTPLLSTSLTFPECVQSLPL
jgi:hypothetical protein